MKMTDTECTAVAHMIFSNFENGLKEELIFHKKYDGLMLSKLFISDAIGMVLTPGELTTLNNLYHIFGWAAAVEIRLFLDKMVGELIDEVDGMVL